MAAVRCPHCNKKLMDGLDGQGWWDACPRCKKAIHINTRSVAKAKPLMVG